MAQYYGSDTSANKHQCGPHHHQQDVCKLLEGQHTTHLDAGLTVFGRGTKLNCWCSPPKSQKRIRLKFKPYCRVGSALSGFSRWIRRFNRLVFSSKKGPGDQCLLRSSNIRTQYKCSKITGPTGVEHSTVGGRSDGASIRVDLYVGPSWIERNGNGRVCVAKNNSVVHNVEHACFRLVS